LPLPARFRSLTLTSHAKDSTVFQTPDNWTEEWLLERFDAYAEVIDAELVRLLAVAEPVPNLHDAMLYSMGLDTADRRIRGKRVRPALCLLTAEALGAPPQKACAFAAAIELLHNFALVHDDIQDGDTMRRGRATVWQQYGLAHGINIGDYMLAKVYSLVLRDPFNGFAVREQLVGLLEGTLEELFAGQSLDISARARRDFTQADYARLVEKKTGSYLAAPIIGGALIGGATEDTLTGIRRFGKALGPLFQIKDDLIDLTAGKGRGAIGNDIREGKRSYLVARVCEVATEAERTGLFAILDKPREATADEDVRDAIALFEKYGVLRDAEAHCERLRAQASEALGLVQPPLRQALEIAATVMANRTA